MSRVCGNELCEVVVEELDEMVAELTAEAKDFQAKELAYLQTIDTLTAEVERKSTLAFVSKVHLDKMLTRAEKAEAELKESEAHRNREAEDFMSSYVALEARYEKAEAENKVLLEALESMVITYRREHGLDGAYDACLLKSEIALKEVEK